MRKLALILGSALALQTGMQAEAQVLSPRLGLEATRKGIGAVPVEIWLKPGATPPPGAVEVAPDRVLAEATPGALEALAQSGTADYIAPADTFSAPQPEAGEDPDDTAAKAVSLWPSGTGRGVTIGILDFGPVPDLPAITARRSFGAPGHGDHFARVAGIVQQLAPGARLLAASLPTSNASATDVAHAAQWLADQGARIITFSGATYLNRRDGLAPLDRLVDTLSARGILWIAAAGNEAQRSWTGWSDDSNGDHLTDITPTQSAITLRSRGGAVQIAVTWDDWGGQRAPQGAWDLDIVLRDAQGREVAAAHTPRGAKGEPVETLTLRDLPAGTYRVELPLRGRGSAVRVRFVALGAVDGISPTVPGESIGSPATARSALAVGAVEQPSFSTARYSGQGPTADQRPKPDLAAIGWGGDGQVGTSYAAPRVAALAACLMELQPELGPVQIRDRLAKLARPVSARRTMLGEPSGWIDSRGHDHL